MTADPNKICLPTAADALRRKSGVPPEVLDHLRKNSSQPELKVCSEHPTVVGLFKCLVFLPGLDIKGFIGSAYAALEKYADESAAEPANRMLLARLDSAEARWKELQAKNKPTGRELDKCLEAIGAAAIATQKAEEDPPAPAAKKPPAPAAKKPPAPKSFGELNASKIYNQRKQK